MQEEQRTVELTIPQVVAGLFLMVAVVGLFSTVTYIAGRARPTAGGVTEVYAASPPTLVAPQPPSVVPVEPAVAAAPASCFSNPGEPRFQEPRPGELYLQAIATSRGIAEVYVEYLRWQGFPSRYAEGPNEQAYRVLVGPIDSRAQYDEFLARLEADGFRPFRRRISPPSEP